MKQGGQILRTPGEGISVVGRKTMGVIVIELEPDDRLASVDVIPGEAVEDAD